MTKKKIFPFPVNKRKHLNIENKAKTTDYCWHFQEKMWTNKTRFLKTAPFVVAGYKILWFGSKLLIKRHFQSCSSNTMSGLHAIEKAINHPGKNVYRFHCIFIISPKYEQNDSYRRDYAELRIWANMLKCDFLRPLDGVDLTWPHA